MSSLPWELQSVLKEREGGATCSEIVKCSREGSFSSKGIDLKNEVQSTQIILTPIKASPSQQRKHKCGFILSPVRKSTRLMKQQKQDIVSDKLVMTTYAYANNEYIKNKPIDACYRFL